MFSYRIPILGNKIKKEKNTLQVQTLTRSYETLSGRKLYKRICFFLFHTEGGVTIEAALVMPLFLFAMTGLLMLGQALSVEEEIARGALETARYCARQEKAQASILMAKQIFLGYVDQEFLNRLPLEGGSKGIHFIGSYYDQQRDEIHLTASGKIRISIPFFPNFKVTVIQNVVQKAFCGYDYKKDQGESDPYVYVTANQSVYHTNRECTHLVLSIQRVYNVDFYLKGKSGLTPCEYCTKHFHGLINGLYITKEGDRYHTSLSCSGLKRTVKRVKKSETGGLSQCQRCQKKEQNQDTYQ